MAISAIALLRIKHLAALSGSDLHVTALEDAVLLHTGAGFACQPETLTRVVRGLVGDALDVEHKDSRGIFFIPDVASPSARTYEAVIEEIGEGGVWGPLNVPAQPSTTALGLGLPLGAADAEGLGALLGNLLEQMPESMLQSVSDAARGQPGALEAASAQLRTMMGGSSDLSSLASQLSGSLGPLAQGAAAQTKPAPAAGGAGSPSAPDLSQLASMLDGTGIDLASMQALVGQVESALAQNPAQTAAMVERLFGSEAARELEQSNGAEDEESDAPEPRTPPAKR